MWRMENKKKLQSVVKIQKTENHPSVREGVTTGSLRGRQKRIKKNIGLGGTRGLRALGRRNTSGDKT